MNSSAGGGSSATLDGEWRVRIKIALLRPFVQLCTPVTVSLLTAHTGSMEPSNIDLIMNCVFFDSHRVPGRENTHSLIFAGQVGLSTCQKMSLRPSRPSAFYFHVQLLIPIFCCGGFLLMLTFDFCESALKQLNSYSSINIKNIYYLLSLICCDKKLFGMSLRSHTMIFLECKVMQK